MSNRATELSFSNEVDYTQKVEINIRLKTALEPEDHKVIVDAADTILSTLEEYLTPLSPNPKDRSK